MVSTDRLNTRTAPDKTASVAGYTRHADTAGKVIKGPQSADGYQWWKIRYDDGVTGWSAQTGRLKKFDRPSREFQVGDNVQATNSLRVREKPCVEDTSFCQPIGASPVSEGTQGTIVDFDEPRPRVVAGFHWWKVEYESGAVGWSSDHRLERVSSEPVSEACPTLPTEDSPAQDHNGDGVCEDANGSGSFGFGDLQTMFTNMEWIEDEGHGEKFDCNETGSFGFGDLQCFFLEIGSQAAHSQGWSTQVVAQNSSPTLTASDATVSEPGNSATIDLSIEGTLPNGLSGGKIRVSFPSELIEITGVDFNDAFDLNNSGDLNFPLSSSSVELQFADLNGEIGSGSSDIAIGSVTVNAVESGSGSIEVEVVSPPGIEDLDENTIDVDTEAGSLNVQGDGSGSPSNDPPNAPQIVEPADGATGVSLSENPEWKASDPNGDDLRYDIYFGTSSSPSKVISDQPASAHNATDLEFDTTYYWKVVAKDEHGATTESPVWQFTTRSSSNTPPEKPTNESPEHETTVKTRTPKLTASAFSDPDGDAHDFSQWQVRKDSGSYDDPVWQKTKSANRGDLTQVTVPAEMALADGTTYWWRVKYADEQDETYWSEWSDETKFTVEASPTDIPLIAKIDRDSGIRGEAFEVVFETPLLNSDITVHIQDPNGSELPTREVTIGQQGSTTVEIDTDGYDLGQYTVWGVVQGMGRESNRVTFTIEAPPNEQPTASIQATPQSGPAPLTVDFNAGGSSDPDGDITEYAWDFDNGETATGETVSHTYDSSGTYTVQLTVTDDAGETDSATIDITVEQVPTYSGSLSEGWNFLFPVVSVSLSELESQGCSFAADAIQWTGGGWQRVSSLTSQRMHWLNVSNACDFQIRSQASTAPLNLDSSGWHALSSTRTWEAMQGDCGLESGPFMYHNRQWQGQSTDAPMDGIHGYVVKVSEQCTTDSLVSSQQQVNSADAPLYRIPTAAVDDVPTSLPITEPIQQLTVSRKADGVTFAVRGQAISHLQATVFNLSGEVVFATSSASHRLTWRFTNQRGASVANGIYLAVVRVQGPHGQWKQFDVRKVVVLR